jgi:hypothetical protein
VASPLLLPAQIHTIGVVFRGYVERGEQSVPHLGAGATLVIVNAPDILVGLYVVTSRRLHLEPTPDRLRQLAVAVGSNGGEIERRDATTVVVTLREGFVADPFSQVPRGASVPFHAGDVARVAGMVAEVEEVTADSRPLRVRFTFDRALDDPSLSWVTWDGRGFVPFAVPAVGEKRPIRGIDYLAALTGG